MKSIYFSLCFLIIVVLISCSSSKVITEYKNGSVATFKANKVLVIGMTSDKILRRAFEKNVSEAIEKNNVIAVKSIDFFENSFVQKTQTISELNYVENQLLNPGFDAVLLTKVTK